MRYYKGVYMALVEIPKLPSLKVGSSCYKGITYYYVQTYTHHYDPVKKHSIRDSQKTVGTIKGNQKYGEIEFRPEFIKQYPQLESLVAYKTEKGIEFKPIDDDLTTVIKASKIEKKIGGTTWAVNQALAQTGIGNALRDTFSKYHRHLKFASIVNYMIQMKTAVMHNYEPFSKIHWLPWSTPLNDGQISSLFKSVTQDDVFRFFKALNNQYQKKLGNQFYNRMFVALDSTSISTYSKLSQADYGHNKDGDTTKQINYLMVCDELTGAPIYGKTYKGNVVDVSTVKHLLIDLETIFKYDNAEHEKPNLIFVTDRGYDSNDNLQDFLRHDYSFVMRSKVNKSAWIQDLLEQSFSELNDDNNHDEFTNQFMYTKRVEYKYDAYPIAGKNNSNRDVQNLFVHMYFDEEILAEKRKGCRFNINSARELYNEKVKAYRETAEKISPEELCKINIGDMQNFINNYCVFDSEGYAKIDKTKLDSKLKFAGYMVLLSDCVEDAKEALFVYRQRQRVERNFEIFKSVLKFNRPFNSNDLAFQGKFLCEFIASAVAILFDTRLRAYEKTEESKKDNFRVSAYSQSRIIDELNTIMLTSYKGGYYFDEISGKYKYLYKALGIPLPEAKYKYSNEAVEECEDEEPYELPDEEYEAIGGEEL